MPWLMYYNLIQHPPHITLTKGNRIQWVLFIQTQLIEFYHMVSK